MLLAFALFTLTSALSTASPTPTVRAPAVVPGEIVTLAEGIRNEKSRLRRLELLAGLMADVKKRVGNLPDDISEAEIPRVQVLYELNILLGNLNPESLNPATCPKVQQAMRQMTNPQGVDDSEISSTGRLALDVVKSVCAP